MSRRKQTRPMKRCLEEPCDEEPSAKHPEPPTESRLPCSSVAYSPISTPSPSTSTAFETPTTCSPLHLLENSLKQFDLPNLSKGSSRLYQTGRSSTGNDLGALFNVVGKISSSDSIGLAGSLHSREEGVNSILKCLQCGLEYGTMDQLVKHMQESQHFNNLPKSYSSLMQLERQKVLNLKLQVKSEGVQLECLKCGKIPSNIDKHLKEEHDIRSCAQWIRSVRVARSRPAEREPTDISKHSASSPHLKNLLSLISTVYK